MISTNFNIIVDRIHGHINDVIDEINACDKRYFMKKICVIGTLEIDSKESRMNAHAMVGSASYSIVSFRINSNC